MIGTMQIVNYFYILLLVSASGLCIALVFTMNRITRSVKEIEIDIKDLSSQIKPLIASTTNLSEKLNYLSEEAKQPVMIAKDIMDDIKDRVEVILAFEEKIRTGVEGPVFKFLSSVLGINNGISAFWNTFKKR
jgi:uncharacterized protein YoxC